MEQLLHAGARATLATPCPLFSALSFVLSAVTFMRSFYCWCFLLAAPTCLTTARALPNQHPPTATVLIGHLDHAPAGDTVRLWVGQQQVKTPLGPTGDFQLVVAELRSASAASLSYVRQRTPLYLTPGDQLHRRWTFPASTKPCATRGAGPPPATTWPRPCGDFRAARLFPTRSNR